MSLGAATFGTSPRMRTARAGVRYRTRLLRAHPGWLCVASALLLSLLGAAAINMSVPGLAMKQLFFLCIGIGSAMLVAWPSPDVYRRIAWPLYLFVLALLVFLLLPGIPDAIVHPRNGARRWISLGLTDLQPSELSKIAFLLVLAATLRYRRSHRSFRGLLPTLALAIIPMGLILVEPDLGTAMLFLPTLLTVLLVAGARIADLAKIILLGLVLAGAMVPMLRPHQRARIMALAAQVQGDTRYEHGIGYQGARSMTLVGAGGLEGHDAHHASMLLRYNHLPERHNDMIFTVICTRWGVWGALLTWGLYLVFMIGGFLTAMMSRHPFDRLVAVGITVMILTQMVVNSGMTLGLFPITGMTLPFVSYGGSSLVVNWLMAGLLLGIARRPHRMLWRESFQFGSKRER